MSERISVSLPGGSFTCLTAGDERAPLVLCLHGFPDHPPSFGPLMRELAQAGYRAVAPWMRGYHPSAPGGPYHLDRLAGDALELADALAPGRPAAVIGHDWGAIATYVACGRTPARFSCAVTLAVPHPYAFTANLGPEQLLRSWYMLFFQLPLLPEWVVARDDFAFIDRLWRSWSPHYRLPEGDRAELIDCLRRSMPAPLEYYRALLRAPVKRGGDKIAVPTLNLMGSDDGCIGAAVAAGQERFFSGPFSAEVVDKAGHFLQLERPVWVAQRALWWLKQHGPRRD